MKIVLGLAVIAATLGAPRTAAAQTTPAPSEMAVRVAEAHKANAALMQQYSWTSRTEITEQGQRKDIRIELVNYGPNGMLQRSLVNDQGAPLPFGFIRRRIAEHERQKMEEYLTGLRDLLEQYTLPTAAKVQAFMSRAKATGPDADGLFEMAGQSVVVPGDTFALWLDPRTHHLRKVHAGTFFQGNAVSFSATFTTLSSGLNHLAYAEVIVPSKQIAVQIQNFDYNRNN